MFFKLLPKFRENFRRKCFELKLILISSNYSQCHGSSDRLRLGVIASHIIISTGFPLTPKIFENFWLSDLVFENLKIFSKSKNIFGLLKIKIPKFKNLKVGWTFEKKISAEFLEHTYIKIHENSAKNWTSLSKYWDRIGRFLVEIWKSLKSTIQKWPKNRTRLVLHESK